eukprot:482345_1
MNLYVFYAVFSSWTTASSLSWTKASSAFPCQSYKFQIIPYYDSHNDSIGLIGGSPGMMDFVHYDIASDQYGSCLYFPFQIKWTSQSWTQIGQVLFLYPYKDALTYSGGEYIATFNIRSTTFYKQTIPKYNSSLRQPCLSHSNDEQFLLLLGGNINNNVQSGFHIFHFSTNKWILNGPVMPQSRSNFACTVAENNFLYIIGGWDGRNYLAIVSIIDVKIMTNIYNKEWSTLTDQLSEGNSGVTTVLTNRNIYVFGGYNENGYRAHVDLINTSTNSIFFDGNTNSFISSGGYVVPIVVPQYNRLYLFGHDSIHLLQYADLPATDSPTLSPTTSPTMVPTNRNMPTNFPSYLPSYSPLIEPILVLTTNYQVEKSKVGIFETGSIVYYVALVVAIIGSVITFICVFYVIFSKLCIRTRAFGSSTTIQTLKEVGFITLIFFVFEIVDVVTDYILAVDLITDENDEISALGWISLLAAIIGLILFFVKFVLMKKLIGFQIPQLKENFQNAQSEMEENTLANEIRIRRTDIYIISLLIGCFEDCPQSVIVVIVTSNMGWNVISILSISCSVLSFGLKCMQIILSRYGCLDPDDVQKYKNSASFIQENANIQLSITDNTAKLKTESEENDGLVKNQYK